MGDGMKKYLITMFLAVAFAGLICASRPAPTIGGEWCIPVWVAFAGYVFRRERREQ